MTTYACRWLHVGVSGHSDDDDDLPVWLRDPEGEVPFGPLLDDSDDPPGVVPLRFRPRPAPPPLAATAAPGMLHALVDAERAMTRLDERLTAAPPEVWRGVIARMSLAEASGWLARAGQWVHPHDLTLSAFGLVGSYVAAAMGGRLHETMPNTVQHSPAREADDTGVVSDWALASSLALAKRLPNLVRKVGRRKKVRVRRPMGHASDDVFTVGEIMQPIVIDPLVEVLESSGAPDTIEARLAIAEWLRRRQADPTGLPVLLDALHGGGLWAELDHGNYDEEVDLRAGRLAAQIVQQSNRFPMTFLPLWSGWVSQQRHLNAGVFRTDPNGQAAVMRMIGEGALYGLREITRLQQRWVIMEQLKIDARSLVKPAFHLAIQLPAFRASTLAEHFKVSRKTASTTIDSLLEHKLITEITKRDQYRAYTV